MFGNWSGRPPFMTLTTAYSQVTPPSCEPIAIIEAKTQCRRPSDVTVEDLQWQIYIEAARNQVESDARRAMCWQRWKLLVDRWPDFFKLNHCPVIAVESVRYLDLSTTGQWITVDPSAYVVNPGEPCRIDAAYAHYWQPARYQMGSIEVTFTAGYLVPFVVDPASDTLSFIDYVPMNGMSFRLSNSGGQLPSGLLPKRTYYIVSASGNTCKLSTTLGGSAIDLTTAGTGLQFLGELPGAARMAMLKHIAVNFADREGSDIAAKCEESYRQSLRPLIYTVL